MKRELFLAAVLFSTILIFGCTFPGGGEKEKKGPGASGTGYTVEVAPQKVVEGGTVTIKLTLSNPWGTDMEGTTAELTGYDTSRFSTTGGIKADINDLTPGQSYPQIWTIEVPDKLLTDTETFSPKIRVCFNMSTTYFFDSVLLPSLGAETIPEKQSGTSSAPISVTQSGLDEIYTRSDGREAKGALEISNVGSGEIQKIYNITFIVPNSTYVNGGEIKYSGCKSTQLSDEAEDYKYIIESSSDPDSDCNKLEEKMVVGKGLTLTASINTTNEVDNPIVIRPHGEIYYKYCYDINVGEITACKPGKC